MFVGRQWKGLSWSVRCSGGRCRHQWIVFVQNIQKEEIQSIEINGKKEIKVYVLKE
jgi:hypothetical protein